MFPCPQCHRSFAKNSKLQEHLLTHTDERPFSCNICDKAFRRKSHLSRHLLLVHAPEKERPFSCSVCEKTFALKHQLNRHLKKHQKTADKYDCKLCQVQFEKEQDLIEHTTLIHQSFLYECPICLKQTSESDSLNEYKTNSKRDYKRHMKRVHAHKLYYCSLCPDLQSFPTWSQLLSHRSLFHSKKNVNDFFKVCLECNDKSFQDEGKWRRHLLMHQGKWKCGECGNLLSSSNALSVHVRTVHQGIKPHACTKCSAVFAHKHLLARHLRTNKCQTKNIIITDNEPINSELITKPESNT